MFRTLVSGALFLILTVLILDLWRWRTTVKRIDLIRRLVGEQVDVAKTYLQRESLRLNIVDIREYANEGLPRLVVKLSGISVVGALSSVLFSFRRLGGCEISGLIALYYDGDRIGSCQLLC